MAEPTHFPQANGVYGKPANMTDEECSSLPVCKTADHVISCWKLTPEELKQVQETGCVYVGILGSTVIPFWVTGEDIFASQDNELGGKE